MKPREKVVCFVLTISSVTWMCVGFSSVPTPKTEVKNAISRGAVCNDGTPAVYYYQKSTSGSTRWLIHLKGGFWCWSKESCTIREKDLKTSTLFPKTVFCPSTPKQQAPLYGLCLGANSPDAKENPFFYDANIVYIPYCSSDSWSGDRAASEETFNYHFRGRRIFHAIVEDLLVGTRNENHTLSDASLVVLSGGSAGGMGVLTNIDYLASLLADVDSTVVGVMDGGYFMDLVPFGPCQGMNGPSDQRCADCLQEVAEGRIVSIGEQVNRGWKLWNGQVDDSCRNSLGKNAWRCYLGDHAVPYLQTPTLVNQFQIDCWQSNWDGIQERTNPKMWCTADSSTTPSLNNTQKAWLEKMRSTFQQSLLTSVRSPHALFSAACYRHASFLDESLNTLQLNQPSNYNASQGITLIDVLMSMVSASLEENNMDIINILGKRHQADPLRVMDHCDDQIDCSINCYPHHMHYHHHHRRHQHQQPQLQY